MNNNSLLDNTLWFLSPGGAADPIILNNSSSNAPGASNTFGLLVVVKSIVSLQVKLDYVLAYSLVYLIFPFYIFLSTLCTSRDKQLCASLCFAPVRQLIVVR